MKRRTWKRVLAALLICVTLVTGPFHAFASTDQSKSKAVSEEETGNAYTDAELRLMSAIIFCEAGAESYAGKVAVGIVVMNRVRSNKFPNTIKGVIYQKNQFTPTRNGMLKRALQQYDSGKFTQKNHLASIKAAKKVLNGCRTVTLNGKEVNMKSYLFFSVYLKGSRLKIGHHRFK
jgi:spore germination cell wall hydrolase CwlJ-like protein